MFEKSWRHGWRGQAGSLTHASEGQGGVGTGEINLVFVTSGWHENDGNRS